MGHGTGVYNATFFVFFMRGVTIGVVGASSLFIARRSGLPQNNVIAVRGLGLTIAPALFGQLIGRALWSGESQTCVALGLAAKALCEFVIPRTISSPILYAAFFVMGIGMALLDTFGDVLVTRIHGEKCAVPLNVINAVYGMGGMVAPFISVGLEPSRAWDFLCSVDVTLAVMIAASRFCRGKPKGWKAKVRGLSGSGPPSPTSPSSPSSPSSLEAATAAGVPPAVLRAGLAFILVAQASETAMSAWGFTFAATTLGQPDRVAALFPATFYFSYTAGRFIVLPASMRLLPSAIVQMGTFLTLLGAFLLSALVGRQVAAEGQEGAVPIRAVLGCVALVGVGTCPLFAMMMASIRQHGDMSPSQQGLYRTCSNLGNTMGMWLPGLVSLPRAECLWAVALVLIIRSNARSFPLQRVAARDLPALP